MKENMNADMGQDIKDWYARASAGREEMGDAKAQAQFGSTKTYVCPRSDEDNGVAQSLFGGKNPA